LWLLHLVTPIVIAGKMLAFLWESYLPNTVHTLVNRFTCGAKLSLSHSGQTLVKIFVRQLRALQHPCQGKNHTAAHGLTQCKATYFFKIRW